MPPESDSRNHGDHGPGPNGGEEHINGKSVVSCKPATNEDGDTWTAEIRQEGGAGEGEDGSDEADAGGVAAGEGEVVDRNDGAVLGVVGVGGAGSADEEFEEGDEEEVEEGAEDEGEEEVAAERGGGGSGKVEGEGDGEEEAEVRQKLQEAEEGTWSDGAGQGVDVEGDCVVEVVDAAEQRWRSRRGFGGFMALAHRSCSGSYPRQLGVTEGSNESKTVSQVIKDAVFRVSAILSFPYGLLEVKKEKK